MCVCVYLIICIYIKWLVRREQAQEATSVAQFTCFTGTKVQILTQLKRHLLVMHGHVLLEDNEALALLVLKYLLYLLYLISWY